jgi:CRISPR type III-A-associated RAMP protein Csm4
MNSAAVVKIRPTGAWRIGTDSGARDRVALHYRSDALYSAVTLAFLRLGQLEEWLAATAQAPAAEVCFSSCFPFVNDLIYVTPPRTIWPPLSLSAKVRWKGARFVPLDVVDALLSGGSLDDALWGVDGASECLVPLGQYGPYRPAVRTAAAVDRGGAGLAPHAAACLEFVAGSGFWFAVVFATEEARIRWWEPLQMALRYLGDTGVGGERSRGWGRFEVADVVEGALAPMLLPRASQLLEAAEATQGATPAERSYWLLSLYIPASGEPVRWDAGHYSLVARGGRVESPLTPGALKKLQNMVAEGSVLVAAAPPRGRASDVAPDGVPHPVYRAGFAVAVPILAQPFVPAAVPEEPAPAEEVA